MRLEEVESVIPGEPQDRRKHLVLLSKEVSDWLREVGLSFKVDDLSQSDLANFTVTLSSTETVIRCRVYPEDWSLPDYKKVLQRKLEGFTNA